MSDRAPAGPRTASELLQHLRDDYRANGSNLSRPGFRAMAVQRLGAYRRNVSSPLLRKPLGLTYRLAHRYVRNHYGIEIHATTQIGRRCFIAHQNGIVVHEWAVIGDDCLIRQGVTIGQVAGTADRPGAPILGDRVEVGVGAVIIGPVTIGDDVLVGPNAVVVRDVPAGSVVMGPPARSIRHASAEAEPEA
jgi:serine O-acetyltransferase